MSGPPLIEATGIHTFYGRSHILHGVDFTIQRGETIALMGRNGMGKTTLLRSLLSLTPPHQGEVKINGRLMTGAKPHLVALQGIAFVPEGRGIFSTLTVREHLIMAARIGRDGRRDWTLGRVLETFPRMAERLQHQGAQLSGGEQQMLTIGRALMTNPDLLILDEATEGLAPLIRAEIWQCLTRLKALGLSILVIDKTVEALIRIADRHYLLERGRVVWSGSSAALAAAPEIQHRYLGI
jgi:branched-chain amino acid transport system ATP-binding protein